MLSDNCSHMLEIKTYSTTHGQMNDSVWLVLCLSVFSVLLIGIVTLFNILTHYLINMTFIIIVHSWFSAGLVHEILWLTFSRLRWLKTSSEYDTQQQSQRGGWDWKTGPDTTQTHQTYLSSLPRGNTKKEKQKDRKSDK